MNVTPPIPLDLKDTATTTTTALAPASYQAMEQFNAIMNAGAPAGATPAVSASAATPPDATTAPHGPMNLGSQILGSLQKSSTDLSGRWQTITEGLNRASATPNVTELLQVQTQLLQVSIHYELVGKAVSKSTQNIDTMVRMQ